MTSSTFGPATGPTILECEDPAAVAQRAAEQIHRCIDEVLVHKHTAVVALSGGSTPRHTLTELAERDVDWSRVQITQVDERLVPALHPDRNLIMLFEALLSRISPASVLAMPPLESPRRSDSSQSGSDHGESPDDVLRAHRAAFAAFAGAPAHIDVAVLGLGDDGHTASLVPGDPVLADTADIGLTQLYNGTQRLTLTVPVLRSATHQIMVVTGESKAAAVARLRRPGHDPAHLVIDENTVVVADSAALGAGHR